MSGVWMIDRSGCLVAGQVDLTRAGCLASGLINRGCRKGDQVDRGYGVGGSRSHKVQHPCEIC